MVCRTVDLAAHAEHVRAVRVFEVDGEVVVDVAVSGIGAALPAAHALIAGYQPPVAPGHAVVLVVAGDSEASACDAAATLATHPSRIADTYAVALDAAGTVIAVPRIAIQRLLPMDWNSAGVEKYRM